MDIAALIIQADKKARDGMWLVLSISTDSLTIRILLAFTHNITVGILIVPKISHSKDKAILNLYVAIILLYNNYV